MRILTITNMYPPHHLGGYELACRDAVAGWRSRGHHVEVLTTSLRLPHASGADDPAVRRTLGFYWQDGVILSPPLPRRIRIERRNHQVLRQAVAEVRPDVVSVWHMGAMSLGLLTRIERIGLPMVLVVYDDWLVYGPEVDAWTRVFMKRPWTARAFELGTGLPTTASLDGQSTAACFMSHWIRRRAEERSPLKLPSRRPIVYGGIDHGVFRVTGPPKDFAWRLICAGRVEDRKGLHFAIEAMASLPAQATLDVVGSLDDETYVRSLRQRTEELDLGDRVRFFGQLDRANLARALGEADIFLFPVVWDEPFGMAPLEAMACGTPVVGTGTGGSGEFLIDEVNCMRVPPRDAAALAQAVHRLAGDDALRRRVIEEGHRTASYFGLDRYIDELEAWHIAASEGFAGDEPPERGDLRTVLGQSDAYDGI